MCTNLANELGHHLVSCSAQLCKTIGAIFPEKSPCWCKHGDSVQAVALVGKPWID